MMGGVTSYILFFLLLVGPLVLVHELGHFVVAKLCGIKVVRFSFGFGPRLLGVRYGDTDYRLSLLPLGGYVKMAGDNPAESLSPEDEGRGFLQAAPWKRALIALAGPAMNLLIPVAVFFAIAVFTTHEGIAPVVGAVMPGSPADRAGMLAGDRVTAVDGKPVAVFEDLRDLIGGETGRSLRVSVDRGGKPIALSIVPESVEEKDDLETTHRGVIGIRPMLPPGVIGVIDPASPAAKAGLQTFDRVVSIAGHPTPDFVALRAELDRALAETSGTPFEVVAIRTHPLVYRGLGPGMPEVVRANLSPAPGVDSGIGSADLVVRWVIPGTAAAKAGIVTGDELASLDGAPLRSWWGFEEAMKKAGEAKVRLGVVAPGKPPREVEIAAEMVTLGESEVTGQPVVALTTGLLHDGESLLPTERAQPREWVFPHLRMVELKLAPAEAFSKSVNATVEVTRKEILGILRMFQGRVSVKKLGGPLMIADVARQAAQDGVAAFLFMMTLVSVNLGLVNLLPLPVLDGGHIVTALVEVVRRKPLSRRAAEMTNAFGLALLLALMVFVLVNDIVQQRGPLAP
jgi:regulator of sigma E protease